MHEMLAPQELRLKEGGQEHEVLRVGVSMHGWIYRAPASTCFYRVMSIEDAPLELRHKCEEQTGAPQRPQTATLTHTWHDTQRFYVRYDAPVARSTLGEMLDDDVPRRNVGLVARVLQAMPGWWSHLDGPLLPTPADILIDGNERPLLCSLPARKPPRITAVLGAPELSLWLAPEFVRGDARGDPRALDVYALGVMLLRCLSKLPVCEDPVLALRHAARADRLAELPMRDDLPYWLLRVTATQKILDAGRVMVCARPADRAEIDLGALANRLEQWGGSLDPHNAANELRASARPAEAYALLQDVFARKQTEQAGEGAAGEEARRPRETYDLLILTAEIAAQDLGRDLEAVDLYQRAIVLDPGRSEAYEGQLRAIAGGLHHEQFRGLKDAGSPALLRLDTMIAQAFERVPPGSQETHELARAEYLLWREQYPQAATFIHPRLLDGSGNYCWWKYGLSVAYARALAGQKAWPQARQQIATTDQGLEIGRSRGSLGDDDYQRFKEALRELEAGKPPSA